MIKVHTFTFNAFQENTYLLVHDSGDCILIDPGCYDKAEQLELDNFISSNNLNLVRLINTHCHIDHALGIEYVKRTYNVKLEAHELEVPVLKAIESYADVYGFPNYEPTSIDISINEGDKVVLGSDELEVLFTPGHAPGHIVLYSKKYNFVIGGDVLFQQSIGRTDLPGGDFDTLIESIHKKLFTLPDDTVVYPGHGNTTTTGFEKTHNPFCAIK